MGSREMLENLTAAWQDAGLNPAAVEPIAEAVGRLDEIEMGRAAIADETAVLGAIADRVAAGKLGFQDGIVELHAAEVGGERKQGGILAAPTRRDRLFDGVQVAIFRLADERLNQMSGELVGIVEAETDSLMAEVEKAAGILEGIPAAARELTAGMTGAERAATYDWDLLERAIAAAGRKEATAFAKLRELDRRHGVLIHVGDALEAVGISRPSGLANTSVYTLAGMLPVRVAV